MKHDRRVGMQNPAVVEDFLAKLPCETMGFAGFCISFCLCHFVCLRF